MVSLCSRRQIENIFVEPFIAEKSWLKSSRFQMAIFYVLLDYEKTN